MLPDDDPRPEDTQPHTLPGAETNPFSRKKGDPSAEELLAGINKQMPYSDEAGKECAVIADARSAGADAASHEHAGGGVVLP